MEFNQFIHKSCIFQTSWWFWILLKAIPFVKQLELGTGSQLPFYLPSTTIATGHSQETRCLPQEGKGKIRSPISEHCSQFSGLSKDNREEYCLCLPLVVFSKLAYESLVWEGKEATMSWRPILISFVTSEGSREPWDPEPIRKILLEQLSCGTERASLNVYSVCFGRVHLPCTI